MNKILGTFPQDRATAAHRTGITETMFIKRGMPVFLLCGLIIPVVALVVFSVFRVGQGGSPTTQDVIVGIALAVLLLAAPVVVVPLVARSFGWARLARHFARLQSTSTDRGGSEETAPSAPAWRDLLCTVSFNKPLYSLNNCVRWAEDDIALTLQLDAPFHLGLPRLVIPWEQIDGFRVEDSFLHRAVELLPRPGCTFPVRLFVPEELVAAELARRNAEQTAVA